MQKMLSFDEAIDCISKVEIPELGDEKVVFVNSIDRVLSQDIVAKENVPLAPLSSMDGYAFAFKDLEILQNNGLRVLQDNPAGHEILACEEGCAIKTFTGAVMPKNTDTIIIIEDIIQEDDKIFLNTSNLPKMGAWVRQIGSSYQEGKKLISRGRKITPYEVGLLAELNYNFVRVKQKARVGVLVSGSEIIEVGIERQHQGQVRSVNNHLLQAMIEKMGAQALVYEILRDDPEVINDTFTKMLKECDLILTTGGMSKGDYDFTQDVIARHSNIVFKGVKIKPGKPVLFAISKEENKPILGLPGNPNAVGVTFYLFGKMLLSKINGINYNLKIHKAFLKDDLIRTDHRLEFRSCALRICNGYYEVSDLKTENFSAIVNNLCGDRALVILQEGGDNLMSGSEVEIILFREF